MFFFVEKSPYQNPDAFLLRPDSHTTFSPDLWIDEEMQFFTSSYAYALNCPYAGLVFPGDLTAHLEVDPKQIGMTEMHKNAMCLFRCDGLNDLSAQCVPAEPCHVIAIRFGIEPMTGRIDHIALRRDDNGLWSFKRHEERAGCRRIVRPRQTDFSGHLIENPETADFGPLTCFGGYAAIPYEGIPFRRRYGNPLAQRRRIDPVLKI